MRSSVRAPGAVVMRLREVTGQLSSASLAASPTSPLMVTLPWVSDTRPTRPGGSVSSSSSCATASVENTARASAAAVLVKRMVMAGSSEKRGRRVST